MAGAGRAARRAVLCCNRFPDRVTAAVTQLPERSRPDCSTELIGEVWTLLAPPVAVPERWDQVLGIGPPLLRSGQRRPLWRMRCGRGGSWSAAISFSSLGGCRRLDAGLETAVPWRRLCRAECWMGWSPT
jgi:hypothetical protein